MSGSYGGHRRHTTCDGRQTMPRVWHKLPTGELKTAIRIFAWKASRLCWSTYETKQYQNWTYHSYMTYKTEFKQHEKTLIMGNG